MPSEETVGLLAVAGPLRPGPIARVRSLDGLQLAATLVTPDDPTARAVVLVHGGAVTRDADSAAAARAHRRVRSWCEYCGWASLSTSRCRIEIECWNRLRSVFADDRHRAVRHRTLPRCCSCRCRTGRSIDRLPTPQWSDVQTVAAFVEDDGSMPRRVLTVLSAIGLIMIIVGLAVFLRSQGVERASWWAGIISMFSGTLLGLGGIVVAIRSGRREPGEKSGKRKFSVENSIKGDANITGQVRQVGRSISDRPGEIRSREDREITVKNHIGKRATVKGNVTQAGISEVPGRDREL